MKRPLSPFLAFLFIAPALQLAYGQNRAAELVTIPYSVNFLLSSNLFKGRLSLRLSNSRIRGSIVYNNLAKKAGCENGRILGRILSTNIAVDPARMYYNSQANIRFRISSNCVFRGRVLRTVKLKDAYYVTTLLKGRFTKPDLVFAKSSQITLKSLFIQTYGYYASRNQAEQDAAANL